MCVAINCVCVPAVSVDARKLKYSRGGRRTQVECDPGYVEGAAGDMEGEEVAVAAPKTRTRKRARTGPTRGLADPETEGLAGLADMAGAVGAAVAAGAAMAGGVQPVEFQTGVAAGAVLGGGVHTGVGDATRPLQLVQGAMAGGGAAGVNLGGEGGGGGQVGAQGAGSPRQQQPYQHANWSNGTMGPNGLAPFPMLNATQGPQPGGQGDNGAENGHGAGDYPQPDDDGDDQEDGGWDMPVGGDSPSGDHSPGPFDHSPGAAAGGGTSGSEGGGGRMGDAAHGAAHGRMAAPLHVRGGAGAGQGNLQGGEQDLASPFQDAAVAAPVLAAAGAATALGVGGEGAGAGATHPGLVPVPNDAGAGARGGGFAEPNPHRGAGSARVAHDAAVQRGLARKRRAGGGPGAAGLNRHSPGFNRHPPGVHRGSGESPSGRPPSVLGSPLGSQATTTGGRPSQPGMGMRPGSSRHPHGLNGAHPAPHALTAFLTHASDGDGPAPADFGLIGPPVPGTRGSVHVDAGFQFGAFVTLRLVHQEYQGVLYCPPGGPVPARQYGSAPGRDLAGTGQPTHSASQQEGYGGGAAAQLPLAAEQEEDDQQQQQQVEEPGSPQPRPARSEYAFFTADAQPVLAAAGGAQAHDLSAAGADADAALSARVSELWGAATDAERAPYEQLAAQVCWCTLINFLTEPAVITGSQFVFRWGSLVDRKHAQHCSFWIWGHLSWVLF